MADDLATLYIRVDSSGVVSSSRDLSNLEEQAKKTEKATDSIGASFRKMKRIVAGLVATFALMKVYHSIKEATLLASRYEMLGVTMRQAGRVAGYTGVQMEEAARGMQKMGISMIASRENTMKMVIAQLDLKRASDLARVAQDVARVANINSSEAFTRMIEGIRSGHVIIFRTMGLMISAEKAYRDYEKANKMAKGSITEAQEAQALMNAVLKEGEKYAGLYKSTLGTATGQMLSMERHVGNLKVLLGQAFSPALAELIQAVTQEILGLTGEISSPEGQEAIRKWGLEFRLTLISIQAEIRRVAIGLDMIGQGYAALQMAGQGPEMYIGTKGSKEAARKQFNEYAELYMDFEKRRKDHDKALLELGKRYNETEFSMSPEGRKRATAAAKELEKLFLAQQKLLKDNKKTEEETEKHVQIREAAEKSLMETIRKNQIEIEGMHKTQFEKDMIRIRAEEEHYKKIGVSKKTRGQYVETETAIAKQGQREEWLTKYLSDVDKAIEKDRAHNEMLGELAMLEQKDMEQFSKDKLDLYKQLYGEVNALAADSFEKKIFLLQKEKKEQLKLLKQMPEGKEKQTLTATIEHNYTQKVLDEQARSLEAKADYYSNIKGMEQKAYDFRLEAIEAIKAAEIQATGDTVAANARASAAKWKLWEEDKHRQISEMQSVFSGTASALEQVSQLYAENSKERERYHKMAMAFETAERVAILAKAVVTAVAAVAAAAANSKSWVEALVAIAAVGGALAAVFSSAGVSFGGKGGSKTPPKPASTVLGAEPGTGSESISKSYELLEETYQMEYAGLTNIYRELQSLNSNITGLVTSIVRFGGFSGEGFSATGKNIGPAMAGYKKLNEMMSTAGFGKDSAIGSIIYKLQSLDFVVAPIFRWLTKTVLKWLWGGETKTSITSSGIKLDSTTIAQLTAGDKVIAVSYADFVKKTKGGLLTKDKKEYWTETQPLDDDIIRLLTSVYKGIGDTLIELSKGLGTDVQAAMDYIFPAININLKGMTTEQINKTLSEYFSKIGDEAAEALFGPLLAKYQKLDEGMYETAIRIYSDLKIVSNAMEMIGMSIEVGATTITKSREVISKEWEIWNTAFQAMNVAGKSLMSLEVAALAEPTKYITEYYDTVISGKERMIEITEAMIEYAGGLEKLTEGISLFFEKFFTESEQMDYEGMMLAKSLSEFGVSLPETAEMFRELVQSIDYTTEEGQKFFATMMALMPMFVDFYSYADKMVEEHTNQQIELMELLGNASEALALKRKIELDVMDESLRPLQVAIWGVMDAQTALSEAEESLSKATADLKKVFDDIISNLQKAADRLKSAKESLKMEGLAEDIKRGNWAGVAFRAILEQTRKGDFSNLESLDKVLEILTSTANSTAQFATLTDYQRNFYKTYNSIAEMEELVNNQLTIEEQSLNALLEINDTLLTIEQVIANYAAAQANYAAAQAAYNLAVSNARTIAAQPYTPSTPEYHAPSTLAVDNRSYLERYPDVAADPYYGSHPYEHYTSSGQSEGRYWTESIPTTPATAPATTTPVPADILAYYEWLNSPGNQGYAQGGYHEGGFRIVGEQGPELEYTGASRIYSNPDSKKLMDTSEIVSEVKKLIEEVKAGNYQLSKNTGKIARVMDNIDQEMNTDGILMRTA